MRCIIALAALSGGSALAQDYAVTVQPAAVSIVAGGQGQIAVGLVGTGGFASSAGVNLPEIAGVTFTPALFGVLPNQIVFVIIDVDPDAAPRTVPVTLQANSPGYPNRSATFQLTIARPPSPPDFDLLVEPSSFEVTAGDPAGFELTVSIEARNGFNGVVDVTAPVVPGLTFTPASFSTVPELVRVVADRDAATGPRQLVFSATGEGVSGIRTSAPVDAHVLAPPFGPLPVLHSVTPDSILRGTRSEQIRVGGQNFVAGAVVVSLDPAIRVERTEILNPIEALVTLSASEDVSPGAYALGMRNPDGGESEEPALLLVYPPGSVAAPLGVRTVAIVHPAEGAILASEDRVRAHGLIAGTGTGTITGVWRIDGVPFDQFLLDVAGGEPVPIESNVPIPELPWGEHVLELVIEHPRVAAPASIRIIAAAASTSGITMFAPEDGATASPDARFRWSLVPGAESYEIEIADVDDKGRPAHDSLRFRRVEAEWKATGDEREAIGQGTRLWRVRALFPGGVRSEASEWRRVRFADRTLRRDTSRREAGSSRSILLVRSGPPRSAVETPPPSPRTHSWLLLPMVATEWKDDRTTGGVQFSTKGDLVEPERQGKWTGDVAFRGGLDPSRLAQVSRNWVAQGKTGGDSKVQAVVGLSVPAFTSGAEFLVSGLARPSVTARATHRFGSLSLYRPIDRELHGSRSPRAGGVPTVGFALESPDGKSVWARLIGLRIEEEPDGVDRGSRLKTFGILGKWTASKRLAIDWEAAHGELDRGATSRSGNAWRLGASGTAAAWRYAVALRHTDATFSNPANRGITQGAFSDRTSADLSLSRSAKSRSLNVVVRVIETGRSSESVSPQTSHAGTTITFTQSLRAGPRLVLRANGSRDRGEGDRTRFLPETDRSKRGLDATLEETLGAFRLSQTLGFQSTRDRVRPSADQDVSTLRLTAAGKLFELLTISALGSFIRNEGETSGTTDQLLITLQPRIVIVSSLTFGPVLSVRRSENGLRNSSNETRQLQAMLQWGAPESIVSAQLATNWTRSESAFGVARTSSTDRGVQVGVTLKWKRSAGM